MDSINEANSPIVLAAVSIQPIRFSDFEGARDAVAMVSFAFWYRLYFAACAGIDSRLGRSAHGQYRHDLRECQRISYIIVSG